MKNNQLHKFIDGHLIASMIISEIIEDGNRKIYENRLVEKKMNEFTTKGMFSLVAEINQQLLTNPLKKKKQQKKQSQISQLQIEFNEDRQAFRISQDSLMALQHLQSIPKEASIQRNSPIKQRQNSKYLRLSSSKISSISSHKQSDRSIPRSKLSVVIAEKLQKLPQEHDEIDKIIDQMRQQTLNHKNDEEAEGMKLKKQNKIQSSQVNYDYEGGLIAVKKNKKNNLVKNNIEVKTDKQKMNDNEKEKPKKAQKSKQNQSRMSVVQTTKIQFQVDEHGKKIEKKNKKAFEKVKQKPINSYQNVQFSQITNLYDKIEVKEGIKAVFDKNIVEKRQKDLNLYDLKKNLGSRKLSRNQYNKIKECSNKTKTGSVLGKRDALLDESKIMFKQNSKDLKQPKVLDSFQPIKPKSSHKKRSRTQIGGHQKIHYQNSNMNELISRTPEIEEIPTIKGDEQQKQEKEQKQELSKIDIYNLQYHKSKGNIETKSKIGYSNNQDKYIQFPKISQHRNDILQNSGSKNIIYPKNRERLKDGAVIMRQIKKKFQDNLRL